MSTLVAVVRRRLDPIPFSTVQLRQRRRRPSVPGSRQAARPHLPPSLEALDLSSTSSLQTLASLRFLILSYLSDLECCLAHIESPDLEAWKALGELKLEEARQWAQTAIEMLNSIRSDVCSHLPELNLPDISTEMETFVKSHLPDLSDVPGFSEMRSHLPDMPNLQDFQNVGSQISDIQSKWVQDVRSRLYDLDFKHPLKYIPTLSDHLKNLHSHLSSFELPSDLGAPPSPSTYIADILALLSSELVDEFLNPKPDAAETEDMLEKAAKEVADAIRRSLNGSRLIRYSDLPQAWRNNPFVTHGYRFIPLEKWPLIIMSVFTFHNETLNIHTHFVPLLLWGIQTIPFVNPNYALDMPELVFMCFALLCLFGSFLWHTMSCVAHRDSMEFCAKVDYVGIGWLISASVGTVVYYGFHCNPSLGRLFLGVCLITGIAGNIFPFMDWFNRHEYRLYRIAFFLALALSAIGPLAVLSFTHSIREVLTYVVPLIPSLLSYLIGLALYTSHFPERILSPCAREWLDMVGGGSHAIWHCFIVLAVSQHRTAISSLRLGIVEQCTL